MKGKKEERCERWKKALAQGGSKVSVCLEVLTAGEAMLAMKVLLPEEIVTK